MAEVPNILILSFVLIRPYDNKCPVSASRMFHMFVKWSRELRRIFAFKREEDGSWRKLHNDELHNLYFSPNIVRVIKSRRIRWAGHVARVGEG
jgi:hypothetical protein